MDSVSVIEGIPTLPGSYALHFCLPSPVVLTVGRLGSFSFPCGEYLYMGSARGPGGLKARLAHHLKQAAHPHWHLDYLRPWALVQGVFYTIEDSAQERPFSTRTLECTWSLSLAQLSGTFVPAAGFGAADCRRGCPAHLVALPPAIRTKHIHDLLPSLMGEKQEGGIELVSHVAATRPPLSC